MAEDRKTILTDDFTLFSSPKINLKNDEVVLKTIVLDALPTIPNITRKVEDDQNEKDYIKKNIDKMNDETISTQFDIPMVPKLKFPKKPPTKIFQPFQSLIDIETTVNGLRDMFKKSPHSDQ